MLKAPSLRSYFCINSAGIGKSPPDQSTREMVRCPVDNFFIGKVKSSFLNRMMFSFKSMDAWRKSRKPTERRGGMSPCSTVTSNTPGIPPGEIGSNITPATLATPPMPVGVTPVLLTFTG
jgi:hypothetical protein